MAITLNGSTGITSVNGSAAAPSVTGADTDTGIVYGTNTLSLATGGTTAVTVGSSQNVGIGTSSPAASLSVAKQTTALSGTSNGYGLYMYPTSSGQCWIDALTSSTNNTSVGLRSYNNGTYYTANLDNSGNFQFNSGYGSTATAYGCRAWVNFNGTGTVAIRGSGNVTSITDNGTGDYTVNFTNAMPDTNYTWCFNGSRATTGSATEALAWLGASPFSTSSVRVFNGSPSSGGAIDGLYVSVAIFR